LGDEVLETLKRRGTKLAGLLSDRNFRLLWAGETISEFGSAITDVAILLTAVEALHATVGEVGALSAAAYLPLLIFGLPAGVWIDRVRRRRLMIAVDVGQCLTIGSVPLAAALGVLGIGQLYAVVFVAGALSLFFNVAYQSMLPSVVTEEQLVEGNAKLSGSATVAGLAGPGVAGVLVQAVGAAYALAADAASFLVSVCTLSAMNSDDPVPAPREETEDGPKLLDGLRFIFNHPVLRALTTVLALANFFFAGAMAVSVFYLVHGLGQSASIVGAISATFSLGSFFGAMLASRISRRLGLINAGKVGLALGAIGAILRPLSAGDTGAVLFGAGTFMLGAGVLIFNVSIISYRQGICPNHMLGRVASSSRLLAWAITPIGALLGGWLAGLIGTHAVLLTAGVGMAMSAGIAMVVSRPASMGTAATETE
jgi:predicted MFS family arabinose efflux permease